MLVPQEFENLLYEKSWQGEQGRFRVSIDENYFGVTRFFGKGSMAGTRAFIATLDEGHAIVPEAKSVRAVIDMRKLDGVPLRAQFLLGKWLLNNKQHFARIAVFGGKAWEMTFARAVAKLARFHNIGFFDDEPSSLGYLNAASESDP